MDKIKNLTERILKVTQKIEDLYGAKIEVKFNWDDFVPPFEGKGLEESLKRIRGVVEDLGLKFDTVSSFATSDANSIAGLGYRVLSIGRGVSHAHTNKESILKKDLNNIVKILVNVAKNYS